MLRNYFITALRNLMRNRLYTFIHVLGLTIGFAAALLIGLFVRDETSYDTWVEGHDQIYVLAQATKFPDGRVMDGAGSALAFAGWLKADFPAVRDVARISFFGDQATLRRGDVEGRDMLFFADPNFFSLLPTPAAAGDLRTALQRPDGIVLTRKLAQKYFGRDDPIGETIEIGRRHPMQITAVIEDWPSNSHLRAEAFASALAPFSPAALFDASPPNGGLSGPAFTYLRLTSNSAVEELQAAFPAVLQRHVNASVAASTTLSLVPLANVHLDLPTRPVPMGGGLSPSGTKDSLYGFALVGLLIVGVAIINFINLMTARATRRAVEIGVRKVSGAERRQLVVQFIGEAFLYVAFAMSVALLVAGQTLPALNTALDRTIPALALHRPAFIASLFALSATIAVLGGLYPALVLSSFRPIAALQAGKLDSAGTGRLRQFLVILQFAVLIGLILVVGISSRQTVFAIREHLRIDTDQVLVVNVPGPPPRYNGVQPTVCAPAFKERVAALPGVRAVACSSSSTIGYNGGVAALFKMPDGRQMALTNSAVDFDFFDFYGMRPLAGRVFQRDHGDADVSESPDASVIPAVINETAARQYGFQDLEKAIGQVVNVAVLGATAKRMEVIGVVSDLEMDVHVEYSPNLYYLALKRFDMLNARLTGRDIPETLAAIEQLWREHGDPVPPPLRFLSDELEARHRDITQQARLFTIFASIAGFIAALGLFGLSAFTAEQRTKEIGIRKSMGARTRDILGLLLWQFAKPVLWANLVAWPAGYFIMQRWLEGFAYHIDLSPWMFIAASGLAMTIAIATVIGHALLVARAQPVTALRYE